MPRPLIPNRPDAILDAAEALVLEHGYDRMTIDRIAARAGIGKGAVYREYDSKPAVLDALLRRSMRRLVATVRRRVVEHEGTVGLSLAWRLGLNALRADPLMLRCYLGDTDLLGSYVRSVEDDRYVSRRRWLVEYLTAIQRAGALDAEVDPDALAIVLSSISIGLISASSVVGPISPEQFDRAVELVITLVERGLEANTAPDPERTRQAQFGQLDLISHQLDPATTTEEHPS
ncbi:TetR/AcrR family transcriptional regulator [Actinoalloteichus sp. AHMU CJ021]|uniref:Transcriptional regulator, TetR family n=1 Tax=Actinoalloteichus caeruleus DSM 43889 TaxID=1120930 RepID=A0ABT1JJ57_ACTCY|nr:MULTISPECIES: TetR/AcrR family transcriptional regulator [Actinoalloteichus]AUS78167.1 TetR/AcrR family transcriptional regulator [Actinoalloteichus sp. AHMU CJ021]MCP2332191.1 transcriptional regulator, TetR family [Actinoalloteichus caeruleus DSM 43889]